jgi:hypothetical protein
MHPTPVPEPWAQPAVPSWMAQDLEGRQRNSRVPAIIWMYWDAGLSRAPAVVQHCVTSWVVMNPSWHVTLLTDDVILDYLGHDWTRESWAKVANKAHKGDIVRITLLRDHGGVWADATQFCLLPLDAWLFSAVGSQSFFALAEACATLPPSVSLARAVWSSLLTRGATRRSSLAVAPHTRASRRCPSTRSKGTRTIPTRS